MFKKLLFSAFFLSFFVLNLNAQEVNRNAIIVDFEVAEDFSITKSSGLRQIVREIKVTKKIQVLSRYGVDEYNKLYIPILEDLEFSTLMYGFSGRTIKKDGQIIEVNEDEIRETTLPANNRYLQNYSGKVKLIAFKRVSVGDVIEFTYTTKYIRRTSDPKVSFRNSKYISKDIPIENFTYSIQVPKKNYLDVHTYNMVDVFQEIEVGESTKYELNLTDIPANPDEEYSLEYKTYPYFSYAVSNSKNLMIRALEDYSTGYDNLEERMYTYSKKDFESERWEPSSSPQNSTSKLEKNIEFFVQNDSLRFDVDLKETIKNQNSLSARRMDFMSEVDSSFLEDQIFLESIFDYPFDRADNFSFTLDSLNSDSSYFQSSVQYSGYELHELEQSIIPISYFLFEMEVPYLANHDFRDERKGDAYFYYTYSDEVNLSLKPPAGYKFVINDYINVEFDNRFGTISSNCRMENDEMKLDLKYIFKENHCSKKDWQKFVEFDREYAKYLSLSILLLKE